MILIFYCSYYWVLYSWTVPRAFNRWTVLSVERYTGRWTVSRALNRWTVLSVERCPGRWTVSRALDVLQTWLSNAVQSVETLNGLLNVERPSDLLYRWTLFRALHRWTVLSVERPSDLKLLTWSFFNIRCESRDPVARGPAGININLSN